MKRKLFAVSLAALLLLAAVSYRAVVNCGKCLETGVSGSDKDRRM